MGFLTLTRLPVGQITGDVPTMGASAWSWPLVGLVIGALSALVWCVALRLGLPALPAATLACLCLTVLTGGLHEDGLADLADGFWGGRDRERRLEIMRDSRIGSYGALAIVFSVLISAGSLASLAPHDGALALIALSTASRAAMPLALHLMPPARSDGLGRAAGTVAPRAVVVALVIGLLSLTMIGLWPGLMAAAIMAATGFALALLALRKIGGQTGDVLGALQQVTELAGWLALAALLGQA